MNVAACTLYLKMLAFGCISRQTGCLTSLRQDRGLGHSASHQHLQASTFYTCSCWHAETHSAGNLYLQAISGGVDAPKAIYSPGAPSTSVADESPNGTPSPATRRLT